MSTPDTAAAAGPTLVLRVWQRFHMRLMLLYGGAVFLVLTLMSAVFYQRTMTSEIGGLQGRLRGVAAALADGITPEMIAPLQTPADAARPEFKEITRRFALVSKAEPQLTHIYIFRPMEGKPGWLRFVVSYLKYSEHGMKAAEIGRPYDATRAQKMLGALKEPTVEDEIYDDEWGPVLSGYSPIGGEDGKGGAGFVGVDVTGKSVLAMKRHALLLAVALFALAALLVGAVSAFVARNVREPLTRIIEATAAIAAGKLDTRAGLVRVDEFGILGAHFDQMAKGLEEREVIRSTFGRYVSEDVAKRILSSKDGARMGGEEREVTVLFSDLKSYSTISETLGPTEVVDFLNEYLTVMNAEIDRHGGCIIEFLGDAILAVFGAPSELEGHPAAALRCAMAMRDALAKFNQKMNDEHRAPWQKKGMASLGQRIGIHTGTVVAGNLGSKVRVKYAVIGDAVNVASRCEGLNKTLGTEILCTGATRALLPDDLKARLKDMGAHPVKGREQPVPVYAA